METKIITELVQFKALDTTTEEQMTKSVNDLNEFQKKHEGLLDAEISKDLKGNAWCIVFHYENFEKVQAIGAALRSSQEFGDFISLIESESLDISFFQPLKSW